MPEITLSNATFERLQSNAQAFVDTPDMVVARALDALELCDHSAGTPKISANQRIVDPQDLPNLKHTKIMEARLDGNVVEKPNWNRLLDVLLVRAMRELPDLDALRRICPANLVAGRKLVDGYRYLSEINVSVQGVSANEACAVLVSTSSRLSIDLDITISWRMKPEAEFPGEIGRLTLTSKS